MKRATCGLLLALVGCGTPTVECSAIFSGNFSDFSSGKPVCPKLQRAGPDWKLTFEVTAAVALTRLGAGIDLGPNPTPGTVSSQGAGEWSATSTREPGCVYAAGTRAVPAGRFTLVLDSVDAPHGSLTLIQGVHALDGVDCGPGDQQRVDVEF